MKLSKVLILGSGGLRIGQAGEFDYSGSQAIKALKEEGIQTVLINPNIATVQTDGDMADKVYFQPLQLDIVQKIIKREKPDGVLVSFGGQTALNLGLQLEGVRILGTPVKTIKITEDRDLFKKELGKISVKTPRSIAVYSMTEAVAAAREIGYPVMIRSGYSLGGLGSGRINSEAELKSRVLEKQMLIEEYLTGWKEIEYEVVRDRDGNTITVCNMENLDPMGIHTGESIVVAPSQTLNNHEYHMLREIAIKTINHLGIVGECNIQYALHPTSGDYRVIEVNARLSRSSALASKATGYPLAYVAAKLALGYRLHELKNAVTKSTSAFFEPALDYLAVKIPRWDLQKMKSSDHHIGSEMKSVGEVMALGRSFPEALQKAIRMSSGGGSASGGLNYLDEIKHPTDRRLFALLEAFRQGMTVKKAHQLSQITPWFLEHIKTIATFKIKKDNLREAKQLGFSDRDIAKKLRTTEEKIRQRRIKQGIVPIVKQIDTLAGEFDSETNYLYTTYHGTEHDVEPLKKPMIVLGSGSYCIGSSVEFDWSAVNTVKTLRKHGKKTIVVNSNPETVSTDFDISDRLYFEELTLERVRDIADFENDPSIVVSVGGQIANNLALPLSTSGYALLGTSAKDIDRAEDRNKFSAMLGDLGIDQPAWTQVTTLAKAKAFAKHFGYPVLIRPSYVLSGGAMNVVTDERQLKEYLTAATQLSPDHPVVISKFITGAKEFEIDAVAHKGEMVIFAISEHIENAGVHSGDATVVLPPQRLYLETVRRAKRVAKKIAATLKITGPFNIQFIAKDNEIKVIECNVRASRSFPFVSKVINRNFIELATEAMLGIKHDVHFRTLDLDYVGVKSPQFSYGRLKGADPVAGVEMASTGEVACLGGDLLEAFYRSWLSTDQSVDGKRILLSIADEAKQKMLSSIRLLSTNHYTLFTTKGTHDFLKQHGISSVLLNRLGEREPTIEKIIRESGVDLVINVPSPGDGIGDAKTIRRLAIDNHIPLITNANIGALLMRCLAEVDLKKLQPRSWQEIIG
ncbi:MAG: carbamoyl-phosphate synthase (glutamine-hydrolyzing) large subunit [Patescibacteria group bacterium]